MAVTYGDVYVYTGIGDVWMVLYEAKDRYHDSMTFQMACLVASPTESVYSPGETQSWWLGDEAWERQA